MNIDWADIEKQVAALAVEIFGGYEKSAVADLNTFRAQTQDDLEGWVTALIAGEISIDELKELVEGQKNLLQLHSLKQWGLAKVALDKFVEGVTGIIVASISKLI